MKQNDELRRLGNKIDALKTAGVFEVREIAESAMSSALRVLTDIEVRLQRVEKLYENVEPLQ